MSIDSAREDDPLFEEVSNFTVRRSDKKTDLLAELMVVIKHEHGDEEPIPLQIDASEAVMSAHIVTFVKLNSLSTKYGLLRTDGNGEGDWAYDLPIENNRVSLSLYPFDDECEFIMEFSFGKALTAPAVAERRLAQAEDVLRGENNMLRRMNVARKHLDFAEELAKHAFTPGAALYVGIVTVVLKSATDVPPKYRVLTEAATDCANIIRPDAVPQGEFLDNWQEHLRRAMVIIKQGYDRIYRYYSHYSRRFLYKILFFTGKDLATQLKRERDYLRNLSSQVEYGIHPAVRGYGTKEHDFDQEPENMKALESLDLNGHILSQAVGVKASGAYSDLCVGKVRVRGRRVVKTALKRFRIVCDAEAFKMLLFRDIYLWSKLDHPNVLPLLGYAFDRETGYPALISEWMERGNAFAFVTSTNPESGDIYQIVLDVARGLEYLHSKAIIHSDLKPENVLIGPTGRAMICDFGAARMQEAARSLGVPTTGAKGTYNYWAPELLTASGAEDGTSRVDEWAFGMTIYALMTQKVPFTGLTDPALWTAISRGSLPNFPVEISQSSDRCFVTLQDVCKQCWERDAQRRPDAKSVLEQLEASQ